MPYAVGNMFRLVSSGQMDIFVVLVLIGLMVMVVAGAIAITTGQRRIPVQYPSQAMGQRIGKQRTYLPLRVNQAGVIPIIFASSILMMPGMLRSLIPASWPWLGAAWDLLFTYGTLGYGLIFIALIIFFSFFYTAITFNPVEMADNMKKYRGVIIGVRPGKATADYLNRIMTRITLTGSVFLAIIAVLPMAMYELLKIPDQSIVQFFGGTSLLILVGVALDTIKQIEQHLTMRHYEGFSAKGSGGRVRARRGR
jgi:preprotein translocase subunit SecY